MYLLRSLGVLILPPLFLRGGFGGLIFGTRFRRGSAASSEVARFAFAILAPDLLRRHGVVMGVRSPPGFITWLPGRLAAYDLS
jgi:hypothetical protein